jgi:RNA polymerase sigma factor (TIGR02999 family)
MQAEISSTEPTTEPDGGAISEAEVRQLLPLVYEELKRSARRERRRLASPDTLSTTALVHETYMRLIGSGAFASRAHFLRVMAVAMRRALIDRLRARHAAKRGSGIDDVPLEDDLDFVVEDEDTVLKVHDALEALKTVDPQLVAIVECRFFAGYSELETAEALGSSERTVRRNWATARAWLKKELS